MIKNMADYCDEDYEESEEECEEDCFGGGELHVRLVLVRSHQSFWSAHMEKERH